MYKDKKGYWVLGLLAAMLVVDQFFHFHDLYTIILCVAAIGAVLVSSSWQAKALALGLVLLGGYWSSLDQLGCSGYWRGNYLAAKASGQLDEVSWSDIYRASFSNGECPSEEDFAIDIELVDEEQVGDVALHKYRTPRGDFWLPGEGRGTLRWLLWEIYEDKVYQGRTAAIEQGDVVIDCGAHVGVMTRYALDQGASKVIAVEPDPSNILCLRRNFAYELAAGTVTLVEKGVWNEEAVIRFEHDVHDSSRHTFQHQPDAEVELISIPVAPLDQIVSELGLEQIDFIKMDIEGAEREALAGAQETLKRFRPEMAICTYHLDDDPSAVREAVARTGIPYLIHARLLAVNHSQVQPKLLFFGE